MTHTTKHTPGPWEHRGNRVYRKDSYEVAWIAGQGPHSEWQANAHLIAAAPAMYEALKIMRQVFEDSEALLLFAKPGVTVKSLVDNALAQVMEATA